jgi:Protein of unknown function (DUF3617).
VQFLKKEVYMLNKNLMILAVIVSLVCSNSALAEIKDGLWEITTKTEIKGMPGQMPPSTVRQCLTKNDPVPKAKDKSIECKMKDQKISGDTMTYAMECKGKDSAVLISGKMTYKGNTFAGASTTNIKSNGQPEMQINNKTSGKYIGPCTK